MMGSFQTPAPFVWLNGWSGVGKLSVAQALQNLMGQEKLILITHKSPDSVMSSHPPTPEVERPDPFSSLHGHHLHHHHHYQHGVVQSPPTSPSPFYPPPAPPNSAATSAGPATPTTTTASSGAGGGGGGGGRVRGMSSASSWSGGTAASTGFGLGLGLGLGLAAATSTSTLATVISAAENLDRTVLMTHRVPVDDADVVEAAREYREQARRAGRLFLPVTVECQLAENVRRLNSEERQSRPPRPSCCEQGEGCRSSVGGGGGGGGGGTGGSSSNGGGDGGTAGGGDGWATVLTPDEARREREGNRLFAFDDVDGLVLNTTRMAPIEAAVRLMEWINEQVDADRARLTREKEAEHEEAEAEAEKKRRRRRMLLDDEVDMLAEELRAKKLLESVDGAEG